MALALGITIALPLYLGPDDLAGCTKPLTTGRCKNADAIVVISGGDTAARVDEAVRLYTDKWASILVVSGAAQDKNSPSNASIMRDRAAEAGVPEDSIVVEDQSRTTAENATNSAALFVDTKPQRVILVTSAYHQRRASIEFQQAFGTGVTIVNHPVANDSQWSSWWWMTPYGWWLGIGEVVKIIVSGASS